LTQSPGSTPNRWGFPRLRALASELAGYDGATQLHQGVEMMITGLQFHFTPADTPSALSQPSPPVH